MICVNAGIPNNSLYNKLIGYWPLDEASGNRAAAFQAVALTLTDNNTVTGNPGKIGTAAQFTAANSEYLSVADNSFISLGSGSNTQYAFTLWFYLDTLPSSGNVYLLVGRNGAGSNFEFDVYVFNNAGTINIGHEGTNNAGTYKNVSQSPGISTGTWYFVYAYADGTNLGISVNNAAATTTAYSGALRDGTAPLLFGSDQGASKFLNGRLDAVGFWKGRVLTQAERDYLYNSGNGRPPL